VFDFTAVRKISRKIVIESDPAKIDRYLARLHATVSTQLQNTRTSGAPRRSATKSRLTRRRS